MAHARVQGADLGHPPIESRKVAPTVLQQAIEIRDQFAIDGHGDQLGIVDGRIEPGIETPMAIPVRLDTDVAPSHRLDEALLCLTHGRLAHTRGIERGQVPARAVHQIQEPLAAL